MSLSSYHTTYKRGLTILLGFKAIKLINVKCWIAEFDMGLLSFIATLNESERF